MYLHDRLKIPEWKMTFSRYAGKLFVDKKMNQSNTLETRENLEQPKVDLLYQLTSLWLYLTLLVFPLVDTQIYAANYLFFLTFFKLFLHSLTSIFSFRNLKQYWRSQQNIDTKKISAQGPRRKKQSVSDRYLLGISMQKLLSVLWHLGRDVNTFGEISPSYIF